MPGFYLRPTALSGGESAPVTALPLFGGDKWFASAEVTSRGADGAVARRVLPAAEAFDWLAGQIGETAAQALKARFSRPRPPFAGLALERPRIMGVINVTPDSFSDGGDRFDGGRAVEAGLAMLEAGGDILDVGGESTRPGAAPVEPEEERRRVVPVVRALAEQGARVSVDTRHAATMAAALEAGAAIVNDVTALTGDPESLGVVAQSDAALVLMHMRGTPKTMQAAPAYDDVATEIYDYLAGRLEACLEAGFEPGRIALDPGIGFGKTVAHNLEVLDRLALYHGLGCALLLGVSRKSFIGRLSAGEAPKARLPGSLAAALAGLARGVQILRVHDVAETAQAVRIWEAIGGAPANNLAAE